MKFQLGIKIKKKQFSEIAELKMDKKNIGKREILREVFNIAFHPN